MAKSSARLGRGLGSLIAGGTSVKNDSSVSVQLPTSSKTSSIEVPSLRIKKGNKGGDR